MHRQRCPQHHHYHHPGARYTGPPPHRLRIGRARPTLRQTHGELATLVFQGQVGPTHHQNHRRAQPDRRATRQARGIVTAWRRHASRELGHCAGAVACGSALSVGGVGSNPAVPTRKGEPCGSPFLRRAGGILFLASSPSARGIGSNPAVLIGWKTPLRASLAKAVSLPTYARSWLRLVTSLSSSSKSRGFTRWASNPASRASAISLSRP